MTAYALGNLAGRLFIAYAIVWTAMLLASKTDWRGAFRRTHRWYGAIGIVTLYVAGLSTITT